MLLMPEVARKLLFSFKKSTLVFGILLNEWIFQRDKKQSSETGMEREGRMGVSTGRDPDDGKPRTPVSD